MIFFFIYYFIKKKNKYFLVSDKPSANHITRQKIVGACQFIRTINDQ